MIRNNMIILEDKPQMIEIKLGHYVCNNKEENKYSQEYK